MFGKIRGNPGQTDSLPSTPGFLVWLFLLVTSPVLFFPPPTSAQTPLPSGATQSAPSTQTEAVALELGKTLERDIAGGQRHSYVVALTDGQFMGIEIKAQGIDLGVVLHLPDGRTRQLYQPFGGIREMAVGEVAESSGDYRMDIYPAAKATPGRYQITLAALHAATAKEKALQEARDLFTRSFGLHKQGRNNEARPLMAQNCVRR